LKNEPKTNPKQTRNEAKLEAKKSKNSAICAKRSEDPQSEEEGFNEPQGGYISRDTGIGEPPGGGADIDFDVCATPAAPRTRLSKPDLLPSPTNLLRGSRIRGTIERAAGMGGSDAAYRRRQR